MGRVRCEGFIITSSYLRDECILLTWYLDYIAIPQMADMALHQSSSSRCGTRIICVCKNGTCCCSLFSNRGLQ